MRINGPKSYSRGRKTEIPITITWQDLEAKFLEQNKKCYWFGVELNPDDIFVPHNPLSISCDRINSGAGYTLDNIVICCRMANLGRSTCGFDEFKKVIEKIKENLNNSL